ncbi:MAG: PAS domain S-box protein [Caldilineaceae bacterium]
MAFQAEILEQVSEAVIAVDQQERIIYLNAAAAAQYEIDPVTAIGEPLSHAYQYEWTGSDRGADDEIVAYVALAEEGYWRGENRHLKRNGSAIQVESTVCMLYDRSGQTTGLLACIRDITARKETEAALQASESRYRQLTNAMPHLVWTADGESVVDYYNIRIHDYDPAVWQGAYGFDWESLLHPADLAPTLAAWQRAAERNESYTHEHRLCMADGSWRWHLSRAVCVRNIDNTVKWYGTATDIHERKQAEEALRQSETRLQLALNAAQMVAWEWNPHTNHITTTAGFHAIYGLPALASVEEGMKLVHAADVKQHNAKVQEVASHGGMYHSEFRITRPDNGHLVWLEEWGYAVSGSHGEVQNLVGVVMDITARKQAEEALRESEARLRMGMSVAGMAIAEIDYITNTILLTPEAAALYALPAEPARVTRQTVHDCFHPDDRAWLLPQIEQVLDPQGDGVMEVEHRIVCPDGQVRWLQVCKQVFFATGEEGEQRAVRSLLAAVDITDRKRAEMALRDSETRLNTILENIPASVYLLSPDQRYLYVNRYYEQLAGITNAEIQGKSINDIFSPETAAMLTANDLRALAAATPLALEESAPHAGEMRTYASVKTPLLDANGEPYALLGISTDITERKRAERHQQFLLDLDAHIRLPADAEAILTTTAERLGQYLAAAHCTFNEIDLVADQGMTLAHWQRRNDAPTVLGPHPISTVVGLDIATLLAAGQSVVISDVQQDPRTAHLTARYAAMGVQSIVRVPFTLKDALLAVLAVADEHPRAWRQDEVTLLENVMARVWPLVVKARAEAALRASEAIARRRLHELEAIYQTAPVGLCVMDQDLRYVRINDRLAAMNGYPAADHIGRAGRELFPDLGAKTDSALRRVLATGEAVIGIELTGEIPTQPGVQHTWIQSWLPLHDETGAVVAINIVVEEITERRRAEAALRESEERLRLATEAGAVGIFDHDLIANQTQISELYARITGFPLDAPPTREDWLALVHPEDRSLVEAIWEESRATGNSYYYECRIVRPDGALAWLEVNALATQDETGRSVRLTGAIRDITERKQTALHQQFLLDLNAALRNQIDAVVIQRTVVERLGDYLGAGRCYFNAIDLAADQTTVLAAWDASERSPGLPPPADIIPLSAYATSAYIADAQAGHTLVVHDANQDERPEAAKARLPARGFSAAIHVPCLRNDQWVASLHVLQMTPRQWRADEVQLVESVVHHFWPLVEKAHAEEALRRQEEFLRRIADNVPGLVGYLGADERYRFVNATFEAWFQRPRRQIIGSTVNELIGVEERARLSGYRQQALAGETVSYETDFAYPDGVTRTIWGRYQPDLAADGAILGFYIFLMDITERKAAEKALRASEERYRALFETMDEGFCVFEMIFDEAGQAIDYRFLEANPAFATFTGLQGVVGKTARQLVPNLEAHWFEIYGDVALRRQPRRFVEGSQAMGRWFEVYAFPFGAPEHHQVALLFSNITERKQAEDALRRSEEVARQRLAELEAIYDTAPIGLCVLDRELRWVRINERLAEINGFPAAAHLGRSLRELLPDLAPSAEPILQTILESEQPLLNVELHGETPAQPGVERIWLEHWFPLHDQDGSVIGINVVAEEVTERRRQERHQQFLSELGMQLRLLSDTDAILGYLASRLGEYLQVAGCRVNEIDLVRKQFILQKDWVAADAVRAPIPSLGIYPLAELAPPAVLAALQAGQTVAVANQ